MDHRQPFHLQFTSKIRRPHDNNSKIILIVCTDYAHWIASRPNKDWLKHISFTALSKVQKSKTDPLRGQRRKYDVNNVWKGARQVSSSAFSLQETRSDWESRPTTEEALTASYQFTHTQN